MERILHCPTLPSLPAVAVQVLDLTANVDVSLTELAKVIQNDQALAAKVLRTVNSSFYGLRRPCSTINQALVMLGLSTVKSLALSFSLVAALGSGADDEFDFVSYWRRGLYTAVAAKSIARAAGALQEDEAFLGGLLQDVGMIAMHQALGRDYLTAVLRTDGDHRKLVKCELATLEVQHPEVGAALAQRWKLPADLVIPVRYHETPTAAPQEYAELVRCVALGNIAHDVLTIANPVEALARFYARTAEWFRLDAAIADDLIERISEGTRQIAPLFRINTGQYPDTAAILARARAQAADISARDAVNPDRRLDGILSDSDERDPLTGTLGFDALTSRADAVFSASRSDATPMAIISIALDGFDRVVAAGGDAAGDAALVEAATLIEGSLGPRGVVGRLEPGVFTVLLPGMDRMQAVKAAGDLRSRMAAASPGWTLPNLPPLPMTASVGVATFEPPAAQFAKVQQLFLAAKRASEAAAAKGGDCVRTFMPRAAA